MAEKEVAFAKQLPLEDQYQQPQSHSQRFLLGDLLQDCRVFTGKNLAILPTDIVRIFFKAKLLFATKTEQEYGQRGGASLWFEDPATLVRWTERRDDVEPIVDRHLAQLEAGIKERTLLTRVSSFDSIDKNTNPQGFFDELFSKLGFPFAAYFDDGYLGQKHKELEPGLPSYDQEETRRFFSWPSIGFRTSGSRDYCFWYSSAQLRTLLNLLRIAGYIHPGQRDIRTDVKMLAPVYPVFLGEHSQGAYKWDEDRQEPWAKIPDGSLFLSFGYRGLAKMWLDKRTFPRLQQFILDHRAILECLREPWSQRSIRDVTPILDILSTAAQIPDSGAKVLLIYCCLEHLFVPRNARTENNKYIVGGINALGSQLLPWFDQLYDLRCEYAHKGFMPQERNSIPFIVSSIQNALALLLKKVTVK